MPNRNSSIGEVKDLLRILSSHRIQIHQVVVLVGIGPSFRIVDPMLVKQHDFVVIDDSRTALYHLNIIFI